MLKHNSFNITKLGKKVTEGCIKSFVFSRENILVSLKRKCLAPPNIFHPSSPYQTMLIPISIIYFSSFIFHFQPNTATLANYQIQHGRYR